MATAQAHKHKGPYQPLAATANDLVTGVPVFRTAAGAWSPAFDEAAVAETPEQAVALKAEAEKDVAANKIVEFDLIQVVREAGALRPKSLREIIRANGPTASTI